MHDAANGLFDIGQIPLSLYIHLPWCLHKCPYCDFNSHATQAEQFPEQEYVRGLIQDLTLAKSLLANRNITSIFIGGGTPSLFSPESIERVLTACKILGQVNDDCEITLESNPGTFEYQKFSEFHACGINRLSIGVQSFQQKFLRKLERIHTDQEAIKAIETAKNIGFENINVDLMFGLPEQSVEQSMSDVNVACRLEVQHISFYNLTLEPNTAFHRFPPLLPEDEQCWHMQQQGIQIMQEAGYARYEVSAYAQHMKQCLHNTNYWQYGDYLGIGAGAHSKITTLSGVRRFEKPRQPQSYMQAVTKNRHLLRERTLNRQELIFEFMLNTLRLQAGFTTALFSSRTDIPWSAVEPACLQLQSDGLLEQNGQHIHTTALGYRFLDSVTERFLPV